MAFRVFENSDQGATFVVTLITLPICVLVTVLRFAVITRSGRKVALENWLAFRALWPYLAWSIYGLVRKWVWFRWLLVPLHLSTDASLSFIVDVENGTKAIFDMPNFDPKVWKDTIKTGYVLQILFGVQQTLAKLGLLIFYYRVFSISKTFLRLSYFVSTILQIMCLNLSMVLAVRESINSAIDFIMVGMAIYIVRELKTSRANEFKLGTLFAFGGLTGLLGFVRIGMAYGTVGDSDHVLVYMILQMASSIICCCVPIYRTVLLDLPGFKWLRTTFGGSSNTKTRPGANSGRPSFKTIGQKLINEMKDMGEEWLQLDESNSTRHLTATAWVDMENGEGHDAPKYPTRTVEVRQTVKGA